MTKAKSIKIDGVDYELDALSDAVKTSLSNLRVVEREMERLTIQLNIAKTARAVYANNVKKNLPKADKAADAAA
jgi:hypothetical protein